MTWLEGALKDSTGSVEDRATSIIPCTRTARRTARTSNLRVVLEPLFVEYGVSVVFSGHDHIYERITPQKGIYYFVSGSAGQLRQGDLRRSAMTAAGFDQDCTFMIVEVAGATMSFEAVSRTGGVVDAGTIQSQARHVAGSRRKAS